MKRAPETEAEKGDDWRAQVGQRNDSGLSVDLGRAREQGRGREAKTPEQIPARGWQDILWRVLWSISADRILSTSGGVAFFALLAILPGIAATVKTEGLAHLRKEEELSWREAGTAPELGKAADHMVAVDRDALRLEVTHLKAAGSKFLASDNAAHHGSAALDISAHQDGRFVHVTIRDDGEGISEKNRERIFEPFFTTRREIGGTGMGLVIVPSMLQAHGGSIALVPSEGGAAFEIRVPG